MQILITQTKVQVAPPFEQTLLHVPKDFLCTISKNSVEYFQRSRFQRSVLNLLCSHCLWLLLGR